MIASDQEQHFVTEMQLKKRNFDILLTVHLNIFILILTNLLH